MKLGPEHICSVWTHVKSQTLYAILKLVKVKVGDAWEPGVLYCPSDSDELYVRTEENFLSGFTLERMKAS